MAENGRHVSIGDTSLYIVERGFGYPILILHGGPGFDHHEFADYLDPLTDSYRLIFVDQRSQGRSYQTPPETWTLKQMARDVDLLANALRLEKYAVLGHSYGAFVALQNAVDYPGRASQSIISGGLPSLRFLERVQENLDNFEPIELRQKVADSWAKEEHVSDPAELAALWNDQIPFHFKDPLDPRIQKYQERTKDTIYSPLVLRQMAAESYGGIDLEDQLGNIRQPVLVLAGRFDRTCVVEGSEFMAAGIPDAELVVFENSAHMMFVEETTAFLNAVRDFLDRKRGAD